MKTLKTAAIVIALSAGSISSIAQVTTMYVIKNDEIVFQSPVSDIDNVTFDETVSGEALIVHKNDNSPAGKTLLNDIQQLSFSGENLSVETADGSATYLFSDIAELLFGDINATGISNPAAQDDCDVLVSVAPRGDVTVESPTAIQSLVLFSVDGKMISLQRCNSVETQCVVPLPDNAGIYLLRIETKQCTIIKKIVKPLNK